MEIICKQRYIEVMQLMADTSEVKTDNPVECLSAVVRDALEYNYGTNEFCVARWRLQALLTLKACNPEMFADLDPEARKVDWFGQIGKDGE